MNDSLTDLLTVDLGDGKQHDLVFPIEAVRAAKKKYGSMKKMLDMEADDLLPELVAVATVDPEITEEWIVKNVSFPVLFRQQMKIIAAFTGKTKTEYETELAEAKASAKNAQIQLVQ